MSDKTSDLTQKIADFARRHPEDTLVALAQQVLTETKFDDDAAEVLREILANKHRSNIGQYITPPSVVKFMVNLIDIPKNAVVLDPTCGTGSYLQTVYKKESSAKLYGIDINKRILEWAEIFTPQHIKINFINTDTLRDKNIDVPHADIVFSNIPGGLRVQENEVEQYAVPSKFGESLFVQRILQLTKVGGTIAMIVPESFLFANSFETTRRYVLETTTLKAIISLPANTFLPYSGIKTSIIILRNTKPQNTSPVYLAKITDLEKEQGQLQKEFSGKSELVMGVNIENIEDNWNVSYYLQQQQFNSLLKSLESTESVQLKDIAEIKTDAKEKRFDLAITQFGTVLLPETIATKKAKKIYVTLKNRIVLPAFIYDYLHSKLGKEQLKGAMRGATIPYITRESIGNIAIPVIPIERQQALLNQMRSHKLNLAALKQLTEKAEHVMESEFLNLSLNKNPYLQKIQKATSSIESYPQPITVLRTRINNEHGGIRQFKEITNLIEFICRYVSIVNMVDLQMNYKLEQNMIVPPAILQKPTFGHWVEMLSQTTKLLRAHSKEDQKPFLSEVEIIDMKTVNQVISAVLTIRNRKEAHATVSEKEYQDLCLILLQHLETLLEAFRFLRNYELVRVDSLRKKENIYVNQVRSLTGASSDFEKRDIELPFALDTDMVYITKADNSSYLPVKRYILCEPCSECGRYEVLLYDAERQNRTQYLAFESGHHSSV